MDQNTINILYKTAQSLIDITNKLNGINNNKLYSMKDNLSTIINIIKFKQWNELLNYNNFDLELYEELCELFSYRYIVDINILKHVIDNIADINYKLKKYNNDSLLTYTLRNYQNIDIIKYLIDVPNIDLEFIDNDGNKPIHLIFAMHNICLFEYIINKNVDLYSKNNHGETPLDILLRQKNIDGKIIKLIINRINQIK